MSQKLPVSVSEGALAIMKGESDKKDSLLVIRDNQIKKYQIIVTQYDDQVLNLNKQIKLAEEHCETLYLSTNNQNFILLAENKHLKKKLFWGKVKQIGFPIITAVGTYMIIK